MKTITIKNLVIQVDGKGENPVQEAQEAIDAINLALQREPYGLGAQIMSSSIDADDVTVEDFDQDIDEEE
jgi:hypothetical protein